MGNLERCCDRMSVHQQVVPDTCCQLNLCLSIGFLMFSVDCHAHRDQNVTFLFNPAPCLIKIRV